MSLPQPRDSFPDAGEAIIDFWSMSGSFKDRHNVEPRVKLYSPRDESYKWAIEKPNLDNARRLRGIYFIDPEDMQLKETIKNVRKKLENADGSCYVLQDKQEKQAWRNKLQDL